MAGGEAASWAVSYGLLLLLALQYGLQPFLTSRFVSGAGCDSRAVVLLTELVKAALCAVSLAASRRTPARRGATPARGGELWRAAAPAACYVVQNLALQRAYADLDSLTFNCLNQLKLVATAACLYLLLRQRQTPQQLGALAMLVAAALLLQLAGEQRAARSLGTVHSFRRGVVACLVASALSGLASALSQIALQHGGTSSAAFTLQMSLLTVPVLLATLVWSAGSIRHAWALALRGWTGAALIPVVTQALGGIVVGLVTKRLGGISKGFAIVGGLVLTGGLQSALEGRLLSAELYAALALVTCSTWLHGRHDGKVKAQ